MRCEFSREYLQPYVNFRANFYNVNSRAKIHIDKLYDIQFHFQFTISQEPLIVERCGFYLRVEQEKIYNFDPLSIFRIFTPSPSKLARKKIKC